MDKKKSEGLAAIILGKPMKEEDSKDDVSSGDDDTDYRAAADEVFNAIRVRDEDAFAESLEAFVKLCMKSPEAKDEE